MGLIKLLFGKDIQEVRYEDVENLISIKKEEDRFLEYKAPDILKSPEKLSKYISAFLNSEGGIIIVGMREDDPDKKEKIGQKIYPVKLESVPKEFSKERIEQLVFSNIRVSIKPKINVYPVRNVDNVVYLIEVLQGDNPPYQSATDKYYRRLNYTCYAMSHYEIADFFGRRRTPKLSMSLDFLNYKEVIDEIETEVAFTLLNEGNMIARYIYCLLNFQLEVKINKCVSGFIDVSDINGNKPTAQHINNEGVIHPKLPTRIGTIIIKIPKKYEGILIVNICADNMEIVQQNISIKVEKILMK